MQTQEALILLVKVAVNFRVLQSSKILNTDTNRTFPIPFKVKYISLRYTQFEKQFRSKQIQLLVCSEPKTVPQQILFLIKGITRNFMLNTIMENGNKLFTSISILFLKLFIMKLIFPEIEGSSKFQFQKFFQICFVTKFSYIKK